jgi:hypothetical protein
MSSKLAEAESDSLLAGGGDEKFVNVVREEEDTDTSNQSECGGGGGGGETDTETEELDHAYSNETDHTSNSLSCSLNSHLFYGGGQSSRHHHQHHHHHNQHRHHAKTLDYTHILKLIPNDIVAAYAVKQQQKTHATAHSSHRNNPIQHKKSSRQNNHQPPPVNYIQRMPPMTEIESAYGRMRPAQTNTSSDSLLPNGAATSATTTSTSAKNPVYKNKRKKCTKYSANGLPLHNHTHYNPDMSCVSQQQQRQQQQSSRPVMTCSSSESSSLSSSANTSVDTTTQSEQSKKSASQQQQETKRGGAAQIKHSSPKSLHNTAAKFHDHDDGKRSRRLKKALASAVDCIGSSTSSSCETDESASQATTRFFSSLFQFVEYYRERNSCGGDRDKFGEFERASKDLMVNSLFFFPLKILSVLTNMK